MDGLGARVRAARHDGDRGVSLRFRLARKVLAGVDRAALREGPVLEEHALQIQGGRPVDAKLYVSPGADPGHVPHVLVADVEAAREARLAVDHHDLAMVAEV